MVAIWHQNPIVGWVCTSHGIDINSFVVKKDPRDTQQRQSLSFIAPKPDNAFRHPGFPVDLYIAVCAPPCVCEDDTIELFDELMVGEVWITDLSSGSMSIGAE